MKAINSVDRAELKRHFVAAGFELVSEDIVSGRIILTGRIIQGTMHTIAPALEVVALKDNGEPLLHSVIPTGRGWE